MTFWDRFMFGTTPVLFLFLTRYDAELVEYFSGDGGHLPCYYFFGSFVSGRYDENDSWSMYYEGFLDRGFPFNFEFVSNLLDTTRIESGAAIDMVAIYMETTVVMVLFPTDRYDGSYEWHSYWYSGGLSFNDFDFDFVSFKTDTTRFVHWDMGVAMEALFVAMVSVMVLFP